ncbi:MAG: hypothetical protein ACO1QB_03760 [Verrucomicrobiales bacterium]
MKHRLLPLMLLTGAGCAYGPQLSRVENHLTEESRRLTTAVVDTLQLQPAEQRDVYSSTALQIAAQDQRIEGISLDPIHVPVLLGLGDVTAKEQAKAAADLQNEFERINGWLKKRANSQQRLLQAGLEAEDARARKVRFWAKLAGFVSLPVAAMIALFVFVPAAIPICGRLLGWVVSKVPSLAGAAGVVSVKAFDAVVKGIERTRSTASTKISGVAPTVSTSALGTEESGTSRRHPDGPALNAWIAELELNLSRGMDQAHKALVQRRKLAFKAS